MDNIFKITTSLFKSILFGFLVILTSFIFFLYFSNNIILFITLMFILIFVEKIFSKQILTIELENNSITIVYLEGILKKNTFDRNDLYFIEKKSVEFRGGENQTIEIYSKKDKTKIFDLNKKSVKISNDYNLLKYFLMEKHS